MVRRMPLALLLILMLAGGCSANSAAPASQATSASSSSESVASSVASAKGWLAYQGVSPRGEDWEPAWSPDGKRLAISTAAGMGDPPKRFGIADGTGDAPVWAAKPIYTHPILQTTPE